MINVAHMTTEALEARFSNLLLELAKINTQVDRAKSNAAATGNYSDRDWFQRASAARRLHGVEQQLIQAELGKRRKAERRAINNRIEGRFIEVAKRKLDPQLYQELMAEVEATVRAEG